MDFSPRSTVRRERLRAALAAEGPRVGWPGHFGLHTGECDVTADGRVSGLAFDRAQAVATFAGPVKSSCHER